MQISDVLGLLGGLALFLYGMKMMSDGLEEGAGSRLSYILETLTNHKIKAVCVGTAITCFIQSSSAMTVMLIGFVNAKVMTLQRAIWVILGANIGTTITGQMMAFDIGILAPLMAILGVILVMFFASQKMRLCGEIIAGFGILFMGLEIMSQSVIPLQESQVFTDWMIHFSHPFLGIVLGMVMTMIIQSSSASIGILQTLAAQNLIPFSQAVYFIFGFDIGTCITALLASLSGCLNAKRLALFHVVINVLGAILFYFICQYTSLISWVASWTPGQIMRQIANMHTFFNVITTLIVLCCDRFILQFVCLLIPQKKMQLVK